MKTLRFKTFSTAAMLVAAFSLLVGPGLFSACQPPVSDEAIVSVQGRVLDVDGTPMANVTVRLVKTDLDVLDADWVVGHIANTDKQPFKEVETDENGDFYIEFEGAEANAGNQLWAAYFVAYVLHPDDPDNHMGVASDSFQFSNQALAKTVPDLHFWDLADDAIQVGADSVTITFDDSPVAPEGGRYIVHVEGTEWTAEVEGNSYELPLSALEPCTAPVKDGPEECQARVEHRVQVISLAKGIRFRTAWHTIDAQNPKGIGLWYRGDDNTSGHTCSGKVLFDLNDGKFSGTNAVQYLDEGMTHDEFRCIVIDLRQHINVEEIFVHNAAIWFHKKARIKFFLSDADEPTDADWVELDEFEGAGNTYPMLNHHLPAINQVARHFKVEFVDVDGSPFWQRIGEISVYGSPATLQ